MITAAQLLAIMPTAKDRIDTWLQPLNDAMTEWHIDTAKRKAAFLAQVAHESGELRWVHELASGNEYEGRKDLGNLHTGDGERYKGRGILQITGKDNYRSCSIALYGFPELLLQHPEELEKPIPAARSAGWFWFSHGLNTLADCKNSFEIITRRINGGLNGYLSRVSYFDRANEVLA